MPLTPRLCPSDTGSALFDKTLGAACGSVGVFTYDIYQEFADQYRGKLAVMFSNPYDRIAYSSWYAVGVFGMDRACDEELYKEMYYGDQTSFVRGKASGPSLTYNLPGLAIAASMSDTHESVLKVQVYNN